MKTRAATFFGELFLLGSGATAFLLMFYSLVGIPWSRWALIAGMVVIAIVALRKLPRIEWPRLEGANAIDALTLILIGGYLRFATVAQPTDYDFLTTWGVKAKEFLLERGIAWRFLETTLNHNAHPDYPILVPLLYDAQALLLGAWPDRWSGLVTAGYGAAALLVVRGLLADDMSKLARAASTFVLMPLVFSPYVGLAEGPLIAYALAGLMFLRRGEVLRGAIHLGLAASCKNEGMTLIVIAALGLIAMRKIRALPQLWPALAIPLPWIVLRRMHGLSLELIEGSIFDRFAARLADPAPLFRTIAEQPAGRPLFWISAAFACIVGWRILINRERLLAIAALLQPLSVLAAYFVSPYNLDWHVRWSWERVLRQSMPTAGLLALLCIIALLPREGEKVPQADEGASL